MVNITTMDKRDPAMLASRRCGRWLANKLWGLSSREMRCYTDAKEFWDTMEGDLRIHAWYTPLQKAYARECGINAVQSLMRKEGYAILSQKRERFLTHKGTKILRIYPSVIGRTISLRNPCLIAWNVEPCFEVDPNVPQPPTGQYPTRGMAIRIVCLYGPKWFEGYMDTLLPDKGE